MSNTLPAWMERWLGLKGGSGEGVAWRLEGHWPWPTWLTLLVAILAALVIVGIYLREGRQTSRRYRLCLAAIRLAVVGIVLAMIAQFELLLQRTGLPYVVVILDDTRSMATVDRYDDPLAKSLEERVASVLSSKQLSRWNIARTLFAEDRGALLKDVAENHKLKFYFLSQLQESRHWDVPGIVEELKSAEAVGDATRLGSAIRGVLDELRGTTPVAIVIATDGINTDGPGLLESAAYARRKGVPLLIVGLGSDRPVRDLNLSDLAVEDVVFVNDLVHFRFQLTAAGFEGRKIKIVLRREGKSQGDAKAVPESVAMVEVTVGPDGRPREIVLPHRPTQPGQFRYTIDIEPPPGGLPTRHPPLTRTIQVREEKIRVLLVQGYPSFEYRFLRNTLSRDKSIELHTLLQEADLDFVDRDKTALRVFPVRREDLLAYDVVVFGDVNPALLSPSAMDNLADFVDRSGKGGAIVFLAGPKFMPQAYRETPLARLLPFDPAGVRNPDPNKPLTEGFVAEATELGLTNPAMQLGDTMEETQKIWQTASGGDKPALPPIYWIAELPELKPSARVLAEHPTRTGPDGKRLPLIVLQYVGGGGKVLFHATDETYRWRRRVGDLYYARYWIQTLRYLSRAKLSEGDRSARLSTDRREYQLGEPIRLQVHFADERIAPLDDNGVTVELEQIGRQTQKVQLHRMETGRGHFEAALNGLPAGGYHAKMVVPTLSGRVPAADFSVAPPQGELARVQMDAAEMRQAADLTHGQYYTCADASKLVDKLPDGRQVPIENLPPVPLWNRWPVLLLFLTLLIGEWLLRKRGGMV